MDKYVERLTLLLRGSCVAVQYLGELTLTLQSWLTPGH
jgi:hypothetical protein